MEKLRNIHPGEILSQDFLKPLNISQSKAANDMHIDRKRISDIIKGKRSISADTAMRFARYFNTTEKFWLGLQDDYDLEEAHYKSKILINKMINPINISELHLT